ncbi:MAG TPA: threonine synthase [Steroidobacteraceae bacterium]|nr:threonine synthase [Steroidobacteraceae bacterium]
MKFVSTRSVAGEHVTFSTALERGLAPDGGLYVPASWPKLSLEDFDQVVSLADVAVNLLTPFLAGDPLEDDLAAICREAFDFPAPQVEVGAGQALSVLELFHGPTAAFKDFGARFLAASLTRLRTNVERPLNILVATSGDTGGAVAAAFHRKDAVRVSVLYPRGLVSPTQEQQLTCWGDNVRTFRVAGTFDDCQRLVKEAFVDTELRRQFDLSSANSINVGRLLPQMVYYAAASLASFRQNGVAPSLIIPAGNLGNAVACVWARHVGLPIGEIVLAHNANRTVPDYLDTGDWRPRASLATLASAMDVGNPSNMERLHALFPELASMQAALRAASVADASIEARIKSDYQAYGQIWCPHTATAAELYARLPAGERRDRQWILVATAHPAKFREIVEPLLGIAVPVPNTLARLFARATQVEDLSGSLVALKAALVD